MSQMRLAIVERIDSAILAIIRIKGTSVLWQTYGCEKKIRCEKGT